MLVRFRWWRVQLLFITWSNYFLELGNPQCWGDDSLWLAHCTWSRYFYIESLRCGLNRLLDFFLLSRRFSNKVSLLYFFDVHILKGPPGLFSNPEVKLERVYGVVTWETSGEMCMTSNSFLFGGFNNFLLCLFSLSLLFPTIFRFLQLCVLS